MTDCHVHLYPEEINRDPAGWARANREPHWAALCTRRRRDGRPVQAFPDPAGLLRAMDAAGVERAILLGWYWERPENCARHNRFLAACVRSHPDRLAACASLQPAAGSGELAAEMRRCREEGFRGAGELSPHAQGCAADDPVLGEALARAAEWGWPVNLHVTDPAGRSYPGSVATPLEDFARLARAHPSANFILAHWGGLLPLRIDSPPPNLHYDTSASPLLYGPEVWGRMLAAAGAGRILFGSDFPLNLYPRLDPEPGIVRLAEEARGALSGAEFARVGGENARRLFSWP